MKVIHTIKDLQAELSVLKAQGKKVGVVQLVTVWPFPDQLVADVCGRVKGVVVPELNLGQLIGEVQRVNCHATPVVGVNKVDSDLIMPDEILKALQEVDK
mgnify:CR=1 FL=1